MVKVKYIPDQGDIVWVNFNPVRGHEQKGKRPAFVVSRKIYNERSGLALICPVTSQEKGYPFEVSVETGKIKGAVLADQVRSIDWKERQAVFIVKSDRYTTDEVKAKLAELMR